MPKWINLSLDGRLPLMEREIEEMALGPEGKGMDERAKAHAQEVEAR